MSRMALHIIIITVIVLAVIHTSDSFIHKLKKKPKIIVVTPPEEKVTLMTM